MNRMSRNYAQSVWLVRIILAQQVLVIMADHLGRIDTHAHFIPNFYRQLLTERNISVGGIVIPAWTPEAHLNLNEVLGVKTSVLSISAPGAKLSQGDSVEYGRKLARQLNEYGYNLTVQYPKEFRFFATLTLPDVEGAVAEAVYALDSLNASGVIVEGNAFGQIFGDPIVDPLLQVLDEREAIVFIHPSQSPCPPAAKASVKSPSTTVAPFAVDFLLDTARAAATLVYNNMTVRYPNIKFLLAHSGGFIPFAAYRIAEAFALMLKSTSVSEEFFLEGLQSMYVDTAISATRTALPSTLAFFPATHLTFGSDYPFYPVAYAIQNSAFLADYRPLRSSRNQRDINFRNAVTKLVIH